MFYIASKGPDGYYHIEEKTEDWHYAVDNFEPIDCIDGEIIIFDDQGNKYQVGPHKDLRKSKSILGSSVVDTGYWDFDKGEPFLIDMNDRNIDELQKLLNEKGK